MDVIKDESYPYPTHWTQVFVSWDRMLKQNPNCLEITKWLENEYKGFGRYQLRGPDWDPAAGFLFYFEDNRDATAFILRWM